MEHPSATKRAYDLFIELWLQTRDADDYTLEDIADAWTYYQATSRLSRPFGKELALPRSPPAGTSSGGKGTSSRSKGSRSPPKAASPEGGCGRKPVTEEYVRVVDSLAVEMDESHHAFVVAAMRLSGDTGLLIRVQPRSTTVVEITRTVLSLGEGRLAAGSRPKVELHERVDVLPLVMTYLKPFLSSKNAVFNLSFVNRAYRNRRCTIEQTRDSMRRDVISELSAILTRSGEEVLGMLRDPSALLLTPDKQARIDLYIAVKKAVASTFSEPVGTLRAMYGTLGGTL
jgi:hypothetical protein